MKSEYSLSVIIPIYNESRLLQQSIDFIDEFVSQHFVTHELIIIESGSTDGSGEICDTIAAANYHVKVYHEGARKGFGSALKLGYQLAQMDLVCPITVDIPFHPESILETLPLFRDYSCILSYRASILHRSTFRRIQSFVYNSLVKRLLRLKVKHVNSALKIFRREIIQSLPLISKGWLIDAEIIYRLQQSKIPFAEIPIGLIEHASRVSSVSWRSSFSLLRELIWFLKAKDI